MSKNTHSTPESLRLAALRQADLLDTPPEADFDDLTRLAASICEVPTALISLSDDERQWFKSRFGLEAAEIPRRQAFCDYAIQNPNDIFVVEDALEDARFAASPLVAGAPHIRFYAGVPLVTGDGFALGSFCVIDYQPRRLSEKQFDALRVLARQVVVQIETRRAVRQNAEISNRYFQILEQAADGIHLYDFDGRITEVNRKFCEITGRTETELLKMRVQDLVAPEDLQILPIRFEKLRAGELLTSERRIVRPDGAVIPVEVSGKMLGENTLQGIARDITERKKTESEIGRREELYRTLVRNLPDTAVILFDTEMRCTLADGAQLTEHDLSQAMLEGKTLHEVLPPEMCGQWSSCYERALGGETLIFEQRDERGQDLLVRIAPVRNERSEIFAGMVMWQDVTVRRRTEILLRQSEKRYRDLTEKSLGLICTHDFEGTILSINPASAVALGYAPEELIGKKIPDLIAPSGRKAFGAYLEQLRHGCEASGLLNVVTKNGEQRVWKYNNVVYEESGSSPFVLGHAEDITELKKAENELRALFAAMRDVILVLDANGRYLKIAPTDPALLYRPPVEIIGKTLDEVFPADQAEFFRGYISDALAANQTQQFEYTLPIGEKTVWFAASVSPMTADTVLMVTRDITERKLMENDLRAARDAAMESARLKSAFLANVSHEIRTPMNGVIGMTELLLTTPLDTVQREYAGAIQQSGDALLTVINDILDLSKIEAGKMRFDAIDFDLRETVESVVELLAERARHKNLEIAVLINADVPPTLRGDPGRFRQVLMNLIGNAVKFTERGAIGVRVETIENVGKEVSLRVGITDTGIGISRENLKNLFQPFVQIDDSSTREFGGTGLGLAISKQIVEMMNGVLSVSSEIGKGSTFSFTARFEKPSTTLRPRREAEAQWSEAPPLVKKNPFAVLTVEDNLINQKIILEQLNQIGIQADAASDGEEALTKLETKSYQLILMDCQMPRLDGYQATAEIRRREHLRRERGERFAPVVIVALTAHSLDGEREKCLAAGIDDYLSKPLKFNDLAAMLERWCDFSPLNLVVPVGGQKSETARLSKTTEISEISDASAPEASTELPILDVRRLLKSETDADDESFSAEIFKLFLDETTRRLAEIERAALVGDWLKMRQTSHALRGNALSIGAERFADGAARLEEAIRNCSSERINHAVEHLAKEFAALRPLLRKAIETSGKTVS